MACEGDLRQDERRKPRGSRRHRHTTRSDSTVEIHERRQSASGVGVALLRSVEDSFISLYSLTRKRDYESPLMCDWKILRTRNGGAAIASHIWGDENENSPEGTGRDRFLR